MKKYIIFSLLCYCLTLPLAAVAEDEAVIDKRTTALYDIVMSPYCPAVTLSACTSSNAQALRDEIRMYVEEGKSDAEIRALLVEQFGQNVLGVPPSEGFGLVGWLMPGLIVIGGFVVLMVTLQRLEARQSDAVEEKPKAERASKGRFEQEIESEIEKRLV